MEELQLAVFPWAAVIAAVAAIVGMIGQSESNKNLAEYQSDRNEDYLQKQLDYNTPANQMQRFKDAGLNPNLIYGQGTSGNQSAPLSFPDIKPPDIQGGFNEIGNQGYEMLRTKLLQAQTNNVESKTIESQAKTGLLEIQKKIASNNPYLNQGAVDAMVSSFISAATIKANEATLSTQKKDFMTEKQWRERKSEGLTSYQEYSSNGYAIMQKELQLLEQKFDLGSEDQKIKAEILTSKEFQNQILEVQKKFMTEGDLTPQHFIAFVQLLLMKLAR